MRPTLGGPSGEMSPIGAIYIGTFSLAALFSIYAMATSLWRWRTAATGNDRRLAKNDFIWTAIPTAFLVWVATAVAPLWTLHG